MKYPQLKGEFATAEEAFMFRNYLNRNKRGNRDEQITAVVRKAASTWKVYEVVASADYSGKVAGRPHHEESETQRACVKWFKLKYRNNAGLLFAVPNGGRREPREAAIMKEEGVTAGVADLLLLIPRHGYHALAVEMKTATGRQSEEQKKWEELVSCNGYKYQICRSFDEFRETIEEYMDEPTQYGIKHNTPIEDGPK